MSCETGVEQRAQCTHFEPAVDPAGEDERWHTWHFCVFFTFFFVVLVASPWLFSLASFLHLFSYFLYHALFFCFPVLVSSSPSLQPLVPASPSSYFPFVFLQFFLSYTCFLDVFSFVSKFCQLFLSGEYTAFSAAFARSVPTTSESSAGMRSFLTKGLSLSGVPHAVQPPAIGSVWADSATKRQDELEGRGLCSWTDTCQPVYSRQWVGHPPSPPHLCCLPCLCFFKNWSRAWLRHYRVM